MPDPTAQDVNQDQDFDDAFEEFSDNESAQDQDEQYQDEQEQDATGDNQDVADTAPEVSELDRYKQEAQQWQHRYNSDMGRQAALQRKVQELEQKNQQLSATPVTPADNPDGSGMSDEQWDTLKEDFPEIAGAVEKRIGGMSSQYEKQIAELQGQMAPIQEQAKQTYLNSQFNILEQQHPDYKTVAQSAEFNQWVASQPSSIQQLKESNEAADAAYLLSTYKLHSGQSTQRSANVADKRSRKLNQARTMPGRTGRNKPTLSDDDFDSAFDYYAK